METQVKSLKKVFAKLLAAVMITSLIISMLPGVALAASADNATFIGSPIPASMNVGQSYTVKITVKNTGTTTWTAAAGYKLVCTKGASTFGNNASYALPSNVKPKASVTFTVVMTAPMRKGTFTSSWQMSKGNAKFGTKLSKSVSVKIPALNSAIVSTSIPSKMYASTKTTMTITMKNIGSTVWTNAKNYKLFVEVVASDGSYIYGLMTLASTDKIAFGKTKTFKFSVTLTSEGKYTLYAQMVNNAGFFGNWGKTPITVIYTTAQLIQKAQDAVTYAEQTNNQSDVNAAQALINRLPAGATKTNLQNRLNVVKAIISLNNAKDAAHTALESKFESYYSPDYSTVNWASLTNAKQAGDTAIDAATTTTGVNTAKTNALAAMAAVKTLAQKVVEEIDNLPAVGSLMLSDKTAVQNVASDYGALTTAQQAKVTNSAKLTAALARIDDLDKAQPVIDAIDALPAVGSLTLADAKDMQQARENYDDLSSAQKALVTNYAKLTAAEDKIDDLNDALQTALNAYDAAVASVPSSNGGKYTNPSWADFTTAINNCDLTLNGADGKDALEAETQKIDDAVALLVDASTVDMTQYNYQVSLVPSDNSGAYTDGSWTSFQAALASCDLSMDPAAGQAAVDAMTTQIEDAIALLVPV